MSNTSPLTGPIRVWGPIAVRALRAPITIKVKGTPGPVGAPGPQGPQGATGAQGPKGDTGPAGAMGPQGPKGDKGDVGAQGPAGPTGPTGVSAYAAALVNGFVGSEAEWLASLIGPRGPQGIPGPKGDTGTTGASAYAAALANGFVGTEAQWLASLVGPKGDTGAQGPTGPQGIKGDTGATGPQGLQGDTGPQGATGPQGPAGPGVPVGGTTGQALVKASGTDYDTAWSTVTSSPAGSTTQVQFNDAGAFGGDAGFTFNKTSKALTIGGATVTTSSPVLDLAQTWNAGAVTFTGLKLDVTDTASAAASLLMDLRVGGVSRFSVRKNSLLSFDYVQPSSQGFFTIGDTTPTGLGVSTSIVKISSSIALQWSSTVNLNSASDLFLRRRAAANLQLGAADAAVPVAQTLSVQSVVAGTTNTAGANLTITGSQGTGTGAGGSIIFQVAPAGSSGTAQNALATALTINSDRSASFASGITASTLAISSGTSTFNQVSIAAGNGYIFSTRSRIVSPADGIVRLLNNADTNFDRLQFGGTTSSFPALKRSTTVLQAVLADDTGFATIQGKLRADVNAVAETPTATHTITITDAAGTAYKVLCVAA